MTWEIGIIGVATFVVSYALTYLLKGTAKHIGLIDVPNERSSHAVPTPRGGGLAIVVSSLLALSVLAGSGFVPARLFLALVPSGAAVAVVGFVDDRWTLSARIRLLVHFMAAGWAVLWIKPVDLFAFERGAPLLEGLVYVLSTLGIVWFLNMYNFMDGIDGIAGTQAVFMSLGTVVLSVFSVGITYAVAPAIVIGAASLGFLLWNWPPAKIFLGDIGSGYLGFVFAVIGLASGIHDPVAPWTLLILAGVFAVDATFTVIRRFLRGERITQPHRTHGFQLLAKKLGHRKVTSSIALVNLLWLLPCALATAVWPQSVDWTLPLALSPLIIGAFAIGAGSRAETVAMAEAAPEKESPNAVIIPFRSAPAHIGRTPILHHAIRNHHFPNSEATIERRATDAT